MFLATFITISTAVAIYLIYKIYLKPLYRLQFYRKQGIRCTFYPFMGNNVAFRKAAHGTSDTNTFYKQKSRVNPERLFAFNLYDRPIIVLHDLELSKEMLMNQHKALYTKDPWRIRIWDGLGKDQVSSRYGEDWKKQRKFFSQFFQYDYIMTAIPATVRITQRAIEYIQPRAGKDKLLLEQFFKQISAQMISERLFGKDTALNHATIDGVPLNIAISSILDEFNSLNNSKAGMIFGFEFVKLGLTKRHKILLHKVRQLKNIFSSIEPEEGSICHALKFNSDLTKEERTDECICFYNSSIGALPNTLAMILYFMWKYPECQQKVLEEINKYKCDEDFENKSYLQAVIKETFRITPPASSLFPRVVLEDHILGDIKLRKGDMVQVEFLYNNFNPDYFDQPDEFIPERWLDKNTKIPPFAYTPFSIGPRMCLAHKLVEYEMMIIISMILKAFKVELDPNYKLVLGTETFNKPIIPLNATFSIRG